jgi:hypothetical protein
VYKIILRKQINAKKRASGREKELREQKHKQQFSVQKKQLKAATAAIRHL